MPPAEEEVATPRSDHDNHVGSNHVTQANGHPLSPIHNKASVSTTPERGGDSGHDNPLPISSPASLSLLSKSLNRPAPSPAKPPNTVAMSPADPAPAPISAEEQASRIKVDKEVARLSEAVQGSSPEAAAKVLQIHWRHFLFAEGHDSSHLSRILRAGFKNASREVVERVLKEPSPVFKAVLAEVASQRPQVIEQVLQKATYAQLLDNVPEDTLDHALSERLKNAPAKQIIKWLAEAERLGFKEDDILDDEDESVMPNIESQGEDSEMTVDIPQHIHRNLALHDKDPLFVEQERNAAALTEQQQPARSHGLLTCPLCRQTFGNNSGYNYHVKKRVCEKIPPSGMSSFKWHCLNCAQGFTTKQGMDYHVIQNRVCMGEDIAQATSPSSQLHQEAAASLSSDPQVSQIPILPPPRTSLATPQQTQYYSSAYYPETQPLRTSLGGTATINRPTFQTPSSSQSQKPAQYNTPFSVTQPPQTQKPSSAANLLRETKADSNAPRQSPSELSPEKRKALEEALKVEEDRYKEQVASVANLPDAERNKRLISFKNSNASRKSQIRKSFGVTLRMRERDKIAMNAAHSNSSPTVNLQSYKAPSQPVRPSSLSNSGSGPRSSLDGTPARPTYIQDHRSSLGGSGTPLQYSSPAEYPTSSFSPVNRPNGPSPGSAPHPTPSSGPAVSNYYDASRAPPPPPGGIPPMGASMSSYPVSRPPVYGNRDSGLLSGPGNYRQSPENPQKRQRTSEEGDGLRMMREENADKVMGEKARKIRVPIGEAQKRWEALQPKGGAAQGEKKSSEVPAVAAEVMVISSSSEGEETQPNAGSASVQAGSGGGAKSGGSGDEVMQSTEVVSSEAEAEEPSSAPSKGSPVPNKRGGFMAKRGGHHS